MQCKCGSEMIYSIHKVTTTNGKSKWIDDALPGDLDVYRWDCSECERHRHKLINKGKIIKEFG